jgi:hypothetical protein
VQRVRLVAQCAQDEWIDRLCDDVAERRDLAQVARGDVIRPGAAATAAGTVAGEVAIIVAIWPDEPRYLLRPSWE